MTDSSGFKFVLYPGPLRIGSTVWVVCPSSGVQPVCHRRLDIAIQNLRDKGFVVKEGKHVRNDTKHVSGTVEERLADLETAWQDDDCSLIFPPWGGELAIELLGTLRLDHLRASRPKWIMGYSDTSTLLFAISVSTGIATAHGLNLMEMVPNQMDDLSSNALRALSSSGAEFTQLSSPTFQDSWLSYEKFPEEPFRLTARSTIGLLKPSIACSGITGRLLGGCIDTVSRLCGTRFGDVNKFCGNLSCTSLILYLENAELSPCALLRALHNMELAGWFEHVKCVLLGRNYAKAVDDKNAMSHHEVLTHFFSPYNFPVVHDADIGHLPPQMTMINGAMANVTFSDGRLILKQTLC